MDEPKRANYEIRVFGPVGAQWCDWFEGLKIEPGCDEADQKPISILSLENPDLAVLHGVLAMIGNLNMTLLSVRRIEHKDEIS